MARLCIFNARRITARGETHGGVLVGDDGRIEALLDGAARAGAENEIDAGGRLLFPGFVDGHVHMRDPGYTHKEDFASGTRAAAAGGVTTVMCMPNTNPPVDSIAGFEAARAAGQSAAAVDFTLQAAITRENSASLEVLWNAGVTSFETLLSDAPDLDRLDDPELLNAAFAEVARLDAIVGIYTGSQARLERDIAALREAGREDVLALAEARAPEAETEGMAIALEAARATGARVVFRQACTKAGFELLRKAKKGPGGDRIFVEATPHHLHLDIGTAERLGRFVHMVPPLRSSKDTAAGLGALADGTIDVVGSDHAPHTEAEKTGAALWSTPGGTPGLDTIAAATLDFAARGKIPYSRVADVLAATPARIFGVDHKKGDLRPGLDGDLVLVDRNAARVVTAEDIRSKAGRSVFEGTALRGWPVLTVLGGEIIAENGVPIEGPPNGRFVPRADGRT
jgi:dihydroorotase (multifunctional complex type)